MPSQEAPKFDDIPLEAYDDIFSQGFDNNIESDFGDYYVSQSAPVDNVVSLVSSNNETLTSINEQQPSFQTQTQAKVQPQTQTQAKVQVSPTPNQSFDITQVAEAFNESIDESSFFLEKMAKAGVNPDNLKNYLNEVAGNVKTLKSPYLDADISVGIMEDGLKHYSVSNANKDIGGATPRLINEVKHNGGNVSGFARQKAIKNGSRDLSERGDVKPKKYSFADNSNLSKQQKQFLKAVMGYLPPHVSRFIDKGVKDAKQNYPKDAFDFNETYSAVLQKASEYDALANSVLPENKGLTAKNQKKYINAVQEVNDSTSIVSHETNYIVDIPNYTPVSASEYAKNQRDKADNIKSSTQSALKANSGGNPPNPPRNTNEAETTSPPLNPNSPKTQAQANQYSELNVLLNAVDTNFTKDPKLDRIKDRLKETNHNMSKLNFPEHMQAALLNHDFSQVGYSSAVSDLNDHNKKNPDNKKDFVDVVVKDYKKKYNYATRMQYRNSQNTEPDVSRRNSPLDRLKRQEQAENSLVKRVGDGTTIHLAEYSLKNISDGARLHVYDVLEKKFPDNGDGRFSSKDVLKTVVSTLRDFDDAYKEISSTDLKHTKTLEQSFKEEYEKQLKRIGVLQMSEDVKDELREAIDDAFDRKGLDAGKRVREKNWGKPTNILPNGKTKQDIKITPPDDKRVEINENELGSLEEQSQKLEESSNPKSDNNGDEVTPKKTKPKKQRYDKDGNPIPDEDEDINITTPRMKMGMGSPTISLFGGNKNKPAPTPAPSSKNQSSDKPKGKLTEDELKKIKRADATNPFGDNTSKKEKFEAVKPSYDFKNASLNDSFANLESQHKQIKEYFESGKFSSEKGFELAEKFAKCTDSFYKELHISMDWNKNDNEKLEVLSKGLDSFKELNKDTEELIKSKGLDNPDYIGNKKLKESGKKTLGDRFAENNESLSKLSENVSKFFSNLKGMLTNKK